MERFKQLLSKTIPDTDWKRIHVILSGKSQSQSKAPTNPVANFTDCTCCGTRCYSAHCNYCALILYEAETKETKPVMSSGVVHKNLEPIAHWFAGDYGKWSARNPKHIPFIEAGKWLANWIKE